MAASAHAPSSSGPALQTFSEIELLNACKEMERRTSVTVRAVGSASNETRSSGPAVNVQKAPQDDSDISETELLNVCKEMEKGTSMTVRAVSSGNDEPEKDVLVAMEDFQDSSNTDLFMACREMEQRLSKPCRNSACDVDVLMPMVSEIARGRADIAMTCTNPSIVVAPERNDSIDSDISDSELLKACEKFERRHDFEKRRRLD